MPADEHDAAGADARLTLTLELVLRPLTPADLEGLEWDSAQAIRAEYVAETLSERGHAVEWLGAFLARAPVGRIGIDYETGEPGLGHLWAFSVLPVLQRRGIGSRLLEAAEAWLAKRGYELAEIGVEPSNADARRLYERAGYLVHGEGTGAGGEAVTLLRKRLAARPAR